MIFELGYGNKPQKVEISENNLIAVLKPNQLQVNEKGNVLIEEALNNPIGAPVLSEILSHGDKVVIVTSDITRPVPSDKIIPSIVKRLNHGGIPDSDITIVFALGSHRKNTIDEMKKMVGETIYHRIRCINSEVDDVVDMGTTSLGTPVKISRTVAEADIRIGVGNIEYHYFAGYSGGAKCIMPGVSTRDAIKNNHRLMTHDKAVAGLLEGNPVREDIEEAIEFCKLHYIVNVILDEEKEIICAVAGHYIQAHRIGCTFLDRLYLKPIKEKADIVIVSQGGFPKDINLYQTQKALDNAKHAVKKGGVIILVGSCKEGFGEDEFEKWMVNTKKPAEMIERIQTDFKLGGHKAAAIAQILTYADIYLVSDMDFDLVRKIFFTPYQNVQDALKDAFSKLGDNASVILMPYGGSTLPVKL
ncbi:MAG: nickel-dependent lactate racemase [Eubacteriales bacterium]